MKKILTVLLFLSIAFSFVGCSLHEQDDDSKKDDKDDITTADGSGENVAEYEKKYSFESVDELYLSLVNNNKGIDIRSESIGYSSEYDLMLEKFESGELDLLYPTLNGGEEVPKKEKNYLYVKKYLDLPWVLYVRQYDDIYAFHMTYLFLLSGRGVSESASCYDILSSLAPYLLESGENVNVYEKEIVLYDGTVDAIMRKKTTHTGSVIEAYFVAEGMLVFISAQDDFSDEFFSSLSFEIFDSSENETE